ncbi:MAG: hypothetical protein HC821_05230 [Lewinella sp.]|nr:hypothetical protein [Lewinella sp.]
MVYFSGDYGCLSTYLVGPAAHGSQFTRRRTLEASCRLGYLLWPGSTAVSTRSRASGRFGRQPWPHRFHDASRHYTTQLGDGAYLAAAAGLLTVDQLRTADLAAGGQGAPLAPLADRYLFPQHQAFLNLGGIANISLKQDDHLLAGDVTGANQILDRLAQQLGGALR